MKAAAHPFPIRLGGRSPALLLVRDEADLVDVLSADRVDRFDDRAVFDIDAAKLAGASPIGLQIDDLTAN